MTEIHDDPKTAPPPPSTLSHPALAVSNINSFIKVTLDIEKGQYITWSELFKIHARAYQALNHILLPSNEQVKPDSLKDSNPELWSRVNVVVLQWIYCTISEDLLNTILERDSTAEVAWNRLRDIFSDNKNSRALYLEQEFSRVQMEQFVDASSYCQQLKSLSDQLYNVGAPVSNKRLVLQLVSGLTDAYSNVGSQICHGDSLPLFYKARSMLVLEETARAKKAAHSTDNSAFLASQDEKSSGHKAGNSSHHTNRNTNRSSTNRSRRSGGCSGKGRGGGRGGQPQQQPYGQPQQQQFSHPQQQQWAGPCQPWATPPCPYPTAANWQMQPNSHR